MRGRTIRRLAPLSVAVLSLSTLFIGGVSPAAATGLSDTCQATPATNNAMTLVGRVSTLRLWAYGDYPVYAHVLPLTSSDGLTVQAQTETITGPNEETATSVPTLDKYAQVDVVAAPPGGPEVWLGDLFWNSDNGDINIMAEGSLADGTASFESCAGFR